MATKSLKPRGRPRKFDPEHAVAMAQALFHARGYDSVSVADVTDALGIKAPSFYAAFASKAALYARVIERYGAHGAVPLKQLLTDERSVAECLSALLEEAATCYGKDQSAPGCIVLEGCAANDDEARSLSRAARAAAELLIFEYIAARHPERAREVTDYVSTVMLGLSAQARQGQGLPQLLATARMAGRVISVQLSS